MAKTAQGYITLDRASVRVALDGTQDVVIIGITLAAILLLVGTGTTWLSTIYGLADMVSTSREATTATLLLNIALILIGWRRVRELRDEIAKRTAAEAEANALANFDPLTGFLNRRALQIQGVAALNRWHHQGQVAAALVIDIDAFKSINDLFGHTSGDAVIVATAERIRIATPSEALLARLGGDEFLVIFPVLAGSTRMDEIGEALADSLSHAIQTGGHSISTSASIGGAKCVAIGEGLDDLVSHADAAMYRAKTLGRCRYERFDDDMGAALARRGIIERELRLALDRDELYPAYEALVDLASGEPIGYEMLARWESPMLGTVTPTEFIAVAETTGLIITVSERLYRRAMSDAVQWPAHLSLSINVSPVQLRDPWFSQKILKLIAETGFPPQRLIIELTESAIVDNIPLAHAVFTSLRNQGIRIALDDFGTGYSSVASLRALPFDSIKLDREFVSRMEDDADQSAVAEAVLQLGQSLGLPVVAEGIENSSTAARLGTLSCAVGQGHYFSQPLSHQQLMNRHVDVPHPDIAKRA